MLDYDGLAGTNSLCVTTMNQDTTDAVLHRLFRRSRSNEVAIAVGSDISPAENSMPSLAPHIIEAFDLDFQESDETDYFRLWNQIIEAAEDVSSRKEVVRFVRDCLSKSEPTDLHNMIAKVPISNYVDTTFDRLLLQALRNAGREPRCYDWDSMVIGNWRQSNPEEPNVFFALPNVSKSDQFRGAFEPTGQFSNMPIQIENIGDMLRGKDLILVGLSACETEAVLHLERLCYHCDKICTTKEYFDDDHYYWARRGVYLGPFDQEMMIEYLLPRWGTREYSIWDSGGLRSMVDSFSRGKRWDCFLSYSSGDAEFARRIENDLRARDIHVWRDESEITIGDSIVAKIEEGLADSYAFAIILTPESINSQWVRDELGAAYRRRAEGDFKILPILHRDCELPPLVATLKYADFREPARYNEQLGMLSYAISDAVRRAMGKK